MSTIINANKSAVSALVNDAEMTLTLEFANGQRLSLDATTLTQDIINAATLHGLKQKLVDAAAIGRDPVTGRSATLSDKFDAVKEVFDRITSTNGTWNKVRAGGEGQKGGLLVRALMQLGNKTRDQVTAHLDTLTKEQVSALRLNKRVVDAMAALRPTVDTDTDSLLDGIIGG